MITVITPAHPTASPLVAPSTLPISNAFDEPVVWLDVPIAMPAATLFFTRKIFIKDVASIAPKLPVYEIATIVMAGIPPFASVIPSAIVIVMDFGTRAIVICFSKPKILHMSKMLKTEAAEPTKVPAIIGIIFLRNVSNSLYIETAIDAVAGARKTVRIDALEL